MKAGARGGEAPVSNQIERRVSVRSLFRLHGRNRLSADRGRSALCAKKKGEDAMHSSGSFIVAKMNKKENLSGAPRHTCKKTAHVKSITGVLRGAGRLVFSTLFRFSSTVRQSVVQVTHTVGFVPLNRASSRRSRRWRRRRKAWKSASWNGWSVWRIHPAGCTDRCAASFADDRRARRGCA